ncbi:MAG: hypothetical protein ACK5TU_09905 [Cyclobacteriaceae bacterium]
MSSIIYYFVAIIHIAVSAFHLHDLFTKSKRADKLLWCLFLLIAPFISVYIYRKTMRRRKQDFFFS